MYSLIIVVTAVIVFKGTWQRNTEYTRMLDAARDKMRKLNIDIDEADKEFEILQKGEVVKEEIEDLLEVALKEGKKLAGHTAGAGDEAAAAEVDNKI